MCKMFATFMTTPTAQNELANAPSQPEIHGDMDLNINENGEPMFIQGASTPSGGRISKASVMGSIREEVIGEQKD